MLTGRLLIDGKDAYSEWGVFVTDGGYASLAAMPSLKALESNDWQEEDGTEYDLSAPVLDTRELTLPLAFRDVLDGFPSLLAALSDGAYHAFEFQAIGRTAVLRLVAHTDMQKAFDLGKATLRLADDFPLAGYEYSAPSASLPRSLAFGGGYSIDGRPLSEYGIRALKGTEADMMKAPDVKPNLKRSSRAEQGAEYDPERVTFKSKEAKLTLLMTAPTAAEFWSNRDALLFDLSRPGLRTLTIASSSSWACWYKGMSVSKLALDGGRGAWMEFTLTLVITKSLSIGALASEDGKLVTTEDGEAGVEVRAELSRNYAAAFAAAMAAGKTADNQIANDTANVPQTPNNTPLTARQRAVGTSIGVDLIKISELPLSRDFAGARTIATDAAGDSVAIALDAITAGCEQRIDDLSEMMQNRRRITEAEIDEITGTTGSSSGSSSGAGGTLIVPITDEYVNNL